jgi:serine/threonine-protein kinase
MPTETAPGAPLPPTTAELRIGRGLESGRREEDERAYLQRRLAIFYGTAAVAGLGFYAIDQVLDAAVGAWRFRDSVLQPSPLVHGVAAAGLLGVRLALSRPRLPPLALRWLDAVGYAIVVVGCILYWAMSRGSQALSPLKISVLATFLVARAVVIPSTPRTTLLFLVPPLVGVPAAYFLAGLHLEEGADTHAALALVWYEAVLLFAGGVAVLASHVSFSLRGRVAEAQRLGDYRLEELIGQGGMGAVYRASHALLRRPTAIKLLRPDITDAHTLTRFEREVQQTSRLTHPNNIQIYDYGRTSDGVFFYAMEFLDGLDLAKVVAAGGPMPPGRAIHVLAQVCAALAEAHAIGLVHRDVKPSNIVLCRRGGEHDVVKVLDFGVLRDMNAAGAGLTREDTFVGTADTASPEVIRGLVATPAADVYAVGVVGYFLVTGERLYASHAVGMVLAHHLATPPTPPSRIRPVPADLEAVLLRCLAKEPDERPASMLALRAELLACEAAGTWTEADATAWWAQHGSPAPASSASSPAAP